MGAGWERGAGTEVVLLPVSCRLNIGRLPAGESSRPCGIEAMLLSVPCRTRLPRRLPAFIEWRRLPFESLARSWRTLAAFRRSTAPPAPALLRRPKPNNRDCEVRLLPGNGSVGGGRGAVMGAAAGLVEASSSLEARRDEPLELESCDGRR